MLRPFALATALALAPTARADRTDAAPGTGWTGVGAPLVNYNSDLGLGLGALGALVDRGDGYLKPYKTYLAGQVLLTTRGVHNHQLWVDALEIFGTPLRFQSFLQYYEEPSALWLGGGQDAPEDAAQIARNSRYYRYRLREMPSVRAALGIPLAQRLKLKVGWRFKRVLTDAYPGSLAALQPPQGLGKAYGSEPTLALVWDSRDREVEPRAGMFNELFLRLARPAWGSTFAYQGATLSMRGYQGLSERVVLAGRLLVDVLGGDPPFFELVQFGGTDRAQGLGGQFSLRGVRQGRFVGKAKIATNLEARVHLTRFEVFGSPLDLGAVGFADAGRAFAQLGKDGPWPGLVYGLGGGLRFVWDDTVVLRIDGAMPIGDRAVPAFYVQIHEMF